MPSQTDLQEIDCMLYRLQGEVGSLSFELCAELHLYPRMWKA